MQKTNYKYTIFSIFCLIISCVSILRKTYFNELIALLLVIHNISSIFLFKDNKKMLLILLMITYFNYSIVICKFLFGGTTLLQGLYSPFSSEVLGKNINLLFLLNVIMFYVASIKKNSIEVFKEYDIKYNAKFILLIFKAVIISVLFYHLYFNVQKNTTIFEYLFIVFIFAFYLSRGNLKEQRIFEVLMVCCALYQLYLGARISILQFFIADFVINYLDKFSIKKIMIALVSGVIFFSVMGVYGDMKVSNTMDKFSLKLVYEQFSKRRFSLDTSVSSFLTSMTMTETANYHSLESRHNNAKDYFTKFLFLGNRSSYVYIGAMSYRHYSHSGGGIIFGQFYYWFGAYGVIFIAFYIGYLLRKAFFSNKKFDYLLCIFLMSTLPRWYLYEPTLLFRGLMVFLVLYILVFKMYFVVKEKGEANGKTN